MNIRKMTESDCEMVAPLLTELGYPSAPETLRTRFKNLSPKFHRLFVAEENAVLAAWAHAEYRHSLASSSRVEIMGMIVAHTYTRQGIGKRQTH